MIVAKQEFSDMINSPSREIRARVELLEGSTLLDTFKYTDRLKSFTIERIGEGKFFGYGICQRLNVKLIDTKRELNITTANSLEVVFGVKSDYVYAFPAFKVSEVHRDENTNELSITAYDVLYSAANYTVADLKVANYYTIKEFAFACGACLGVPVSADYDVFNTYYDSGANFDGTETIREALNAIAEATQTIYYIDSQWRLVFKRLDLNGAAQLRLDKEKYFTLDSSTSRRLSAICHATELGDNVSASLAVSGTTQYVRDNPFWDLRNDVGSLIEDALAAVGGLTINQFTCSWRGNYLLEIGDKLELITKDDDVVYSYLLNDTITYDGALSEETQWSCEIDESETESNPSTLTDLLKHTYARVDKANREIELVAGEVGNTRELISGLQITTEAITATVKKVEEDTNATYESLNNGINKLTSQVQTKMSAEDVKIEINKTLSGGVDKVITSTGFTFDGDGLTISKSGTEMSTLITEDGMRVYKDNVEVLTANNVGVNAINLHATTYLLIGTHSRFEDYETDRTGCFYVYEVN